MLNTAEQLYQLLAHRYGGVVTERRALKGPKGPTPNKYKPYQGRQERRRRQIQRYRQSLKTNTK